MMKFFKIKITPLLLLFSLALFLSSCQKENQVLSNEDTQEISVETNELVESDIDWSKVKQVAAPEGMNEAQAVEWFNKINTDDNDEIESMGEPYQESIDGQLESRYCTSWYYWYTSGILLNCYSCYNLSPVGDKRYRSSYYYRYCYYNGRWNFSYYSRVIWSDCSGYWCI